VSSTALLPGRHVSPRSAHEEQHPLPPPPPGGGDVRDEQDQIVWRGLCWCKMDETLVRIVAVSRARVGGWQGLRVSAFFFGCVRGGGRFVHAQKTAELKSNGEK
jgi:hypothetical protein